MRGRADRSRLAAMVRLCVALALLLFGQACIVHTNNPPPGGGGGGYAGGGYAQYPPGSRVSVLWKGTWYAAVVRQTSGNLTLVHYVGYSNSWDEWVAPGRIRGAGGPAYDNSPPPAYNNPPPPAYNNPPPPAAMYYSPGSRVSVLWKGSWYPAVVLKRNGNLYYVHYDGYSSSWNEWVAVGRIR